MKSTFVVATLVLTLASVMGLSNTTSRTAERTDAPFRDGKYLGKLAAENGENAHIAAGRWSKPEERQAFTTGYLQGYEGVVGVKTHALKGNLQAAAVALQ